MSANGSTKIKSSWLQRKIGQAPERFNCVKLAAEITETRLRRVHGVTEDLRCDLIGVRSLHAHADYGSERADTDVRLRVAGRFRDRERAEAVLWEVESLLCAGPAGGGGFRGRITPSIVTHDAFLPRADVPTRVEVLRT